MGPIERPSARALIDLFNSLPSEERLAFYNLLGRQLVAEDVQHISTEMTMVEREKYMKMLLSETMRRMWPVFATTAARMAIASPGITEAALGAAIGDGVREAFLGYGVAIGKVEAEKLKAKRDRHSDPETIKRNVEICDLRRSDPKKWSHRRLATKFGVTPQYIGLVLKEEVGWRRQDAAPSN